MSPPRRRFRLVALALLPALLIGATATAAAAGPAQDTLAAGPATPADLTAHASATSIALAWRQPTTGTRAVSFRVYDHGQLVARHTSTRVTLADLAFGSYHAIKVTAVDAAGQESVATPEIRLRAWVEGAPPNPCLPYPPMWWTVTVTDLTATSAMLSWPSFMPGQHEVRLNGTAYQVTEPRGMRVGGLTPDTRYEVQLARLGCGGPQIFGGGQFTTKAGRPAPPPPVDVRVLHSTESSVTLTWARPLGGAYVHQYAVYEDTRLVTTSWTNTVTIRGLYHAEPHRYTVVARDWAGNESAHSAPVDAVTATCQARPPRPTSVRATARSASTVLLEWAQDSLATSYTVYEGDQKVTTVRQPAARVSGLASDSTHTYRVTANLIDDCGETVPSDPVTVSTPDGPTARPEPPTGLRVGSLRQVDAYTVEMWLQWRPPQTSDPTGYILYDGTRVAGHAGSIGWHYLVRQEAGTRKFYTVTSTYGDGTESAPSAILEVVAPYLPPP